MILKPARRRIRCSQATGIVASRYPPIDIYERVPPDPAVWEALIAAEMPTNPRVRDEVGEWLSGPGARYVMAPSTHRNFKGGRFSDAGHGACYAGSGLGTAIAETSYHFGKFAANAADGPRYEDMRVLVGRIDASLHDRTSLETAELRHLPDPDDYTASQACAASLRESGSTGVHYPSVRHPRGRCVAVFRPTAAGIPVQARHLQFHWDGTRLRRYFDYEEGRWVASGPAPAG